MEKHKIAIVGCEGMVGGSLKRYFQEKPNYKLFLYDIVGVGSMEEVNKADFIYVCVPTPYKGKCDTSILEDVISKLDGEKIIIIKSTVIPGTTDRLQEQYKQHKFLFNPEFLTELTADQDASFPDRQIVGYTEESYSIAGEVMLQLPLAPFERIMPAAEAEMVKYAGNCWFAMKVAYANQLFDLCEKVDIDYKAVLEGMSADKRIGRTHLKIEHKGYRGYGGKCLPKDSKALLHFAKENGIKLGIINEADVYNDELLKKQGLDPLDTDKGVERKNDAVSYSSSKVLKVKYVPYEK